MPSGNHLYNQKNIHKMNLRHVVFFLVFTALAASCSKSPVRVACIGDSITEGTGLDLECRDSYPVMLDSLLGDRYTVLNCGRSTTTMLKVSNLPYWNMKEIHNLFVFQPAIITIKLGTNDTKPFNWNAARFERDYQALIDTLATLPGPPRIFLCLPVPVYQDRWGINDSTLTAGVIPAIRKVAAANKLPVIDLYTPMLPYAADFPDAIHPNAAGTLKIATLIAQAITGS
jgi:alpha-L-fucosidase 2